MEGGSKTALSYYTMVERYPNLKEEVGSSSPGCQISSLLPQNLSSGQLPSVLWPWRVGCLSPKRKEEEKDVEGVAFGLHVWPCR